MATKTIAVDVQVYEELAAYKHPGESFSRAIHRVLQDGAQRGTGQAILSHLETMQPLSDDEAKTMLSVAEENREEGIGGPIDLR